MELPGKAPLGLLNNVPKESNGELWAYVGKEQRPWYIQDSKVANPEAEGSWCSTVGETRETMGKSGKPFALQK
jgi:hypothetical protein